VTPHNLVTGGNYVGSEALIIVTPYNLATEGNYVGFEVLTKVTLKSS
jgi:hypothetical protein